MKVSKHITRSIFIALLFIQIMVSTVNVTADDGSNPTPAPTDKPNIDPPIAATPNPLNKLPQERLYEENEIDIKTNLADMPLAASGRILYATNSSDSIYANTCESSNTPCSLNEALYKSKSGDTIRVTANTYYRSYTSQPNVVIIKQGGITLSGGWNSNFTNQRGVSIIDGLGSSNGILVDAPPGNMVVIEKFTIQNSQSQNGGGIYVYQAWVTLKNSTVKNNSAFEGGGLFSISNAVITIENSTFSENTGNVNGASIYAADGSLHIKNSTIAFNTGTGVSSNGDISNFKIENSIIANNTAGNCNTNIKLSSHNIYSDGCALVSSTNDLLNTDPFLTAFPLTGQQKYLPLPSTSPAINSGNAGTCLSTDQRGVPRPVGSVCDIGAYEYTPADYLLVYTDSSKKNILVYQAFEQPVTAQILDNEEMPISGALVTFTAPASGASGTFTNTHTNITTAITNASGIATSSTFTANGTAGIYDIRVSISGPSTIAKAAMENYPGGNHLLQDSSFERYTPTNYDSSWYTSSYNLGSPICAVLFCGNGAGTAGPHTGSKWIWFGGIPANYETAVVSQNFIIPELYTKAYLRFYFWIGYVQPGSDINDKLDLTIDGNLIFSANATQQALYSQYTPVIIDISRYADGKTHKILFNFNSSNQLVNFNLDDVTLTEADFTDVVVDHWAYQYVERLYHNGITTGCDTAPLVYCPDNTVTRAQMAVFLLKSMHGSSYTPPAVEGSTGFDDVAANYWAAPWIKQLAAESITSGCGDGNYCPETTVTRAQMAIFLLKAKHGSTYSPSAATGVFIDVPVGYWADKWIEQLAMEGVTSGCSTGMYCPNNSVTRAQMAVFLVKAFSLP